VAVTAPAVPATGVAALNPTGDNVNVTLNGTGTTTGLIVTQPNPPAVNTPAVPASPAVITNTNAFPVSVSVTGGTVTVIAVNGSTVYTATGNTVVVPAGGTLGLTYSVVPTIAFTAVAGGVSGNPVSNTYSIDVPPGCSIIPIYSVAPGWVWTNPDDLGYTPGYYAPNLQAEAAGWNPYTALPYAQHAALGVSGLATGVSN
jgi:hypothetical protein